MNAPTGHIYVQTERERPQLYPSSIFRFWMTGLVTVKHTLTNWLLGIWEKNWMSVCWLCVRVRVHVRAWCVCVCVYSCVFVCVCVFTTPLPGPESASSCRAGAEGGGEGRE